MDAKILRKWGLKAVETKDNVPASPTSFNSGHSAGPPVDYAALAAWLPPIPHFERQRLSQNTLNELQKACAIILKETTPDDAELDQTDPLEEFQKSVARQQKPTTRKPVPAKAEKKTAAERKDAQNSKEVQRPPKKIFPAPVRTGKSISVSQNIPDFPEPARRIDNGNRPTEPHPSVQAPAPDDYYNPGSYKAASTDYLLQDSAARSRATPKMSTVYSPSQPQIPPSLAIGGPPTSHSSDSFATAEASRYSQPRLPSVMTADLTVKGQPLPQNWVSRTRPQQEEDIHALPQLHKAPSKQSLRSGLRSRAESIRDGIRDYVKPASRGASRPGTSLSNQPPPLTGEASRPESRARPESRSSVASTGHGRSWWRGAAGALRRRGSFTSFRSSQNNSSTELAQPTSPLRDFAPDVNKNLPPMPSLDTYVEPKIHISQLMIPQAPAVPQNSHASPESSSPAGLRSPPTIHTVMSPPPPQTSTPKLTHGQSQATPQGYSQSPSSQGNAQTYSNNHQQSHPHANQQGDPRGPRRSNRSPALTPASENTARQQRTEHKPRPLPQQVVPSSPTEKHRSEHISPAADPGIRTYYSPAHQLATADLTNFSDTWREELLAKDMERRRRYEVTHIRRKEEKRRLDNERRKTIANMKNGRDRPPAGLKNRLSKMFGGGGGGAVAHARVPPQPSGPMMTEDEMMEKEGRGQSQLFTVAH